MAEVRAWLDHHRIEPKSFDHTLAGPSVALGAAFDAAIDRVEIK
jgi:hypothetical protein